MLNFSFYVPTRLVYGEGCVQANDQYFQGFGRRAFVVTGAHSAERSGALDDVVAVLSDKGIAYEQFAGVENNPSLENVETASAAARQFEPDFIVAIGGGSPLDAAKAVAVLAVNDMTAEQLYSKAWPRPPLPILAIPTTAGTGSEVTPYSVLTIPDKETKQGFGGPDLFPKVSFLDWRYTESLPRDITIDTAVDALSHLVEGYLATRASDASDMLAEHGIRLWGRYRQALTRDSLTPAERDGFLAASALGGMTISHTGTTFVHALGYPLTYYHDIPHGQANGLVIGGYLRFTEEAAPDKVENILRWLRMDSLGEFAGMTDQLFPGHKTIDHERLEEYAQKASETRNVANSLGEVTASVMADILKDSVG